MIIIFIYTNQEDIKILGRSASFKIWKEIILILQEEELEEEQFIKI